MIKLMNISIVLIKKNYLYKNMVFIFIYRKAYQQGSKYNKDVIVNFFDSKNIKKLESNFIKELKNFKK